MDASNLKARDARDRMINILGIGIPYPLRDLALKYPPMVSLDQQAEINILGGQTGVRYQVCDEDGNPIFDEDGSPFEVLPEAGLGADGVVLRTPKIVKDITFTILACRQVKAPAIGLETYLNQTVSIKAGIDTTLQVEFRPAEHQISTDHQITINYGDTVKVAIEASQEGIFYTLVRHSGDGTLSADQKGDKSEIHLKSSELTEDTRIKVKACRTLDPNTCEYLDTPLSVNVRPNPKVAVGVQASIIDYKAKARLSLANPQSSAEYQLYQRELVLSEYVSQETQGRLEIQTDEGHSVFLITPEKISNWEDPSGFILAGIFKKRSEKLSITTGSLSEDMLFIVQATKNENKENRESLQLDQAVVVLVRPDTAPAVKAQQPLIDSNTFGMVTISKAQKGVEYQLRLDQNNKPVNPPGFPYEDRGVETTRLEVDFVVEAPGDPLVLLPTGRLAKKTTFNVLAIKILTKVSAQLKGKATIDILPVSGGEKPAG